MELSSGIDEYEMKITGDGIYYFTVAVEYEQMVYTDTVAVEVLDRAQLDAFLKGKWNTMKTALINNDVNGAVRYFHRSSKDDYKGVFGFLASEGELSGIATAMREIELYEILPYIINGSVAKCEIKREETINGTVHEISYFIYFEKDADGVWKIHHF